MMYNKDRKNEYISEVEHRNHTLRRYLELWFDRTYDKETEYGKDLCDFTANEILDFYRSMFSNSLSTLVNLNANLSCYAEWCLRHNVIQDKQNHFSELSIEALSKCVNAGYTIQGIYTRSELLKQIGGFQNPCDQFLVLGLFEGLLGQGMSDFWNIYPEDFKDGRKLYLRGTERTLEISQELYDIGQDSIETFAYATVNGAGTSYAETKFKEGDTRVIKALWNSYKETDKTLGRRMISKLKRLQEAYGLPITRTNLRESGRIDYMLRIRKDDEGLNEIISNHKEDIDARYGRLSSYSKWKVMYGSYITNK